MNLFSEYNDENHPHPQQRFLFGQGSLFDVDGSRRTGWMWPY